MAVLYHCKTLGLHFIGQHSSTGTSLSTPLGTCSNVSAFCLYVHQVLCLRVSQGWFNFPPSFFNSKYHNIALTEAVIMALLCS